MASAKVGEVVGYWHGSKSYMGTVTAVSRFGNYTVEFHAREWQTINGRRELVLRHFVHRAVKPEDVVWAKPGEGQILGSQ